MSPFLPQEKPDIVQFYKESLKKSIERDEFNINRERAAKSLISFLNKDDVQVRLFEKGFLHGKSYIFKQLVITGSSNFTYSGLTNNTELNAVLTEAHSRYVREEWFDKFWEQSKDFKNELIEIVERSKFGTKTTPYEVYLKALFELQKEDVIPVSDEEKPSYLESKVDLAEFQSDAVQRVQNRLKKYNGALVADSVGLGKTWIAKKIIEEFGFYKRKNFLVICPAQIRDSVWRRELKDLGVSENIISQEDISSDDYLRKVYKTVGGKKKLENLGLFVIDESHNFRNPLAGIFRTILLKRLESSIEAFRKSLKNQISFLNKFKQYFKQGKILRKKMFNKYISAMNQDEKEEEDVLLQFEKNLENIKGDMGSGL